METIKEITIGDLARETTSVIAGPEYEEMSLQELKHKAARFDELRYGKSSKLLVPISLRYTLDEADNG